MKIRMNQISRALSALVSQMIKDEALQNEKITSVKCVFEDKRELTVPDKEWFCNDIHAFALLPDFIKTVLEHDKESKEGK